MNLRGMMRGRLALRDDTGGALLDVAVVAPFLMMLLVGTIDIGRYEYQAIELGNAVRAGVQYGAHSRITAYDTDGMISATTNDAHDVSLANVTANNFCSCHDSGSAVSCSTLPDPCTAASASDYRDLFVTVAAQGTYTPLVQYPGFTEPLGLSRVATQQVSP